MASQNPQGLNKRVYPRQETSPHRDQPLSSPAPKGIPLRSPGIQQDWTTVPQQPQELQPSPDISVITEAVLHQLPSDHTNPRYPEPLLGAQLAPFPLSWPRPPALPTWTICPLWKNASFLTLTSLLMCRPLMNWELHEPGISVKNVPDRGSPSPETLVPTQYRECFPPVGMAKVLHCEVHILMLLGTCTLAYRVRVQV